MQEQFTVFIDESGEAGIEKVRSQEGGGASPYMTLGACLIRNKDRKLVEDNLNEIQNRISKKYLHCSQLKHYQILYYIRKIKELDTRIFGVISHKNTLGSYKQKISDNSSMYYNKCAQYLLERIGWFLESRKISSSNVQIIFEKANVDYDKMKNLLRACQKNPKHQLTRKLRFIDVDNIKIMTKNEEPIIQIADLVAHALYKCVDKTDKNFRIPEPRYLRELSSHFFGHPETGLIVGAGLHCVHSLRDVQLDADVEAELIKMSAASFSSQNKSSAT